MYVCMNSRSSIASLYSSFSATRSKTVRMRLPVCVDEIRGKKISVVFSILMNVLCR